MRYNNANYIYQKNHQGSVTEITAANQSTVKSYKYDAFGDILQETGPSVPGALTYTSRPYHSRSGLYYYRARWYDPELGRFITQDPIGHAGGVNLYGYVRNDPVNLIDPLGLLTEAERMLLLDFIRGQLKITKEFKDIASGKYCDSLQKLGELFERSETMADTSGYRSDYYKNLPAEIREIIEIHESYHKHFHAPFNYLFGLNYLRGTNGCAEAYAAEEYRAYSISNRLLIDLYFQETYNLKK